MLKQIQAATGLVFFVFLAAHLANTWLAMAGPDVYDGTQSVLRVVYQFAPVEALLLSALVVHLIVGFVRMYQDRGTGRARSPRARAHRWAGVFLAVVAGGHVLAVRGPSWFFDVYPGFAGLAFSIDFLPGYFYPYYFLLGVAGFYHALNGLGIASRRLGFRLMVPTARLNAATAGAAIAMALALLGLGGVLFDVGNPAESGFAELAQDLFPDMLTQESM